MPQRAQPHTKQADDAVAMVVNQNLNRKSYLIDNSFVTFLAIHK